MHTEHCCVTVVDITGDLGVFGCRGHADERGQVNAHGRRLI